MLCLQKAHINIIGIPFVSNQKLYAPRAILFFVASTGYKYQEDGGTIYEIWRYSNVYWLYVITAMNQLASSSSLWQCGMVQYIVNLFRMSLRFHIKRGLLTIQLSIPTYISGTRKTMNISS